MAPPGFNYDLNDYLLHVLRGIGRGGMDERRAAIEAFNRGVPPNEAIALIGEAVRHGEPLTSALDVNYPPTPPSYNVEQPDEAANVSAAKQSGRTYTREEAASSGGGGDETTRRVREMLKSGQAFQDARGVVHVYDPFTGKATGAKFEPIPGTDKFVFAGGADSLSADASARLGFDREKMLMEANQHAETLQEGRRQFDETSKRGQFNSDREFTAARDEFAKKYQLEQYGQEETARQQAAQMAENQYQFDYSQIAREAEADDSYEMQRAGLSMQAEARAAELAQQGQDRARDILKTPADFLARSYFTRGEVSPQKEVTQADLLNTLNAQIAGSQAALRSSVPAARARRQRAMPTRPAGYTPGQRPGTPSFGGGGGGSSPSFFGLGDAASFGAANPGNQSVMDMLRALGTPGYEKGGVTHAKYFMVGEAGPELIANPEKAPVGVMSNEETAQLAGKSVPGFQFGTDYQNYTAKYAPTKYNNPRLGSQYASQGFGNYQMGQPLAGNQTIGNWFNSPYLNRNTAPGTRGSISGSGIMNDYAAPNMEQQGLYDAWNRGAFNDAATAGMNFEQWIGAGQPRAQGAAGDPAAQQAAMEQQKQITQQQLREEAIKNAPPAVRDIMAGKKAKPLRFGFSAPTAQLLSTMTPDELEALGTRLAVDNTSLEDVLFATQQNFGAQQQGRPRYLGVQ